MKIEITWDSGKTTVVEGDRAAAACSLMTEGMFHNAVGANIIQRSIDRILTYAVRDLKPEPAYRYERMNCVEVMHPDVERFGRMWHCQIFRQPIEGGDYEGAHDKFRQAIEAQFQWGVMSLDTSGPQPIRTSAPYSECIDPVLMVLRPIHVKDMEIIAEIGLCGDSGIGMRSWSKRSR